MRMRQDYLRSIGQPHQRKYEQLRVCARASRHQPARQRRQRHRLHYHRVQARRTPTRARMGAHARTCRRTDRGHLPLLWRATGNGQAHKPRSFPLERHRPTAQRSWLYARKQRHLLPHVQCRKEHHVDRCVRRMGRTTRPQSPTLAPQATANEGCLISALTSWVARARASFCECRSSFSKGSD